MSSILDALNKVEEDRNAQASDSDEDAPFAPETAAEVLIAQPKKRRSARQSPPINWKPFVYAGGGLAGVALIVGLSAGVALLVGSANHSAAAVAVAAKTADSAAVQAAGNETYTVPAPAVKESPAPSPGVKASNPPAKSAEKPHELRPLSVEAKPKPPEKPAVAVAPHPKPAPPVEIRMPEPVPTPAAMPAAEPMRVAKAEPVPEQEPTTPLPTEEAMARVRAEASEARPPAPVRTSPTSLAPGRAAEKRAPFLEDVNALPRLGQNERERLGLGDLRLNVLREASPSQPEGLAIINLKKVYVGETIPGTNARLIAVRTRAIAIEIDGTGERFKVTN